MKGALAIRGFSSSSSRIPQELILKIVICRFVKLWKLSERIWAMLQGKEMEDIFVHAHWLVKERRNLRAAKFGSK